IAFSWVPTIAFEVPKVVPNVGARGGETEGGECAYCGQELCGVQEREGGEQRHEEQEILPLLMHTHRTQPWTQSRAVRWELTIHGRGTPNLAGEHGPDVDED